MPQIRPEDISNRIRLANELGTAPCGLVPKDRAVDPDLALSGPLVSAVVDKLPPHEARIGRFSSKHDLFARADELRLPPTVRVRAP